MIESILVSVVALILLVGGLITYHQRNKIDQGIKDEFEALVADLRNKEANAKAEVQKAITNKEIH